MADAPITDASVQPPAGSTGAGGPTGPTDGSKAAGTAGVTGATGASGSGDQGGISGSARLQIIYPDGITGKPWDSTPQGSHMSNGYSAMRHAFQSQLPALRQQFNTLSKRPLGG